MKLDFEVEIGRREATAREMWTALWRLHRLAENAGRGSGAGDAQAALWTCLFNLAPEWVDRMVSVAAATGDSAMTIPANLVALRPLRAAYFRRLRRARRRGCSS